LSPLARVYTEPIRGVPTRSSTAGLPIQFSTYKEKEVVPGSFQDSWYSEEKALRLPESFVLREGRVLWLQGNAWKVRIFVEEERSSKLLQRESRHKEEGRGKERAQFHGRGEDQIRNL